MARVWDEQRGLLGLRDFSPASQDRAALNLIKSRGALDYVKVGNISLAVRRLNRTWASLPGNNYQQGGGKSMAEIETFFRQGGGTLTA